MLNDQDISGNTVFVEMMRGYYDLPSTLHIPSLRGDVIFRSYQGQEVHVTGGKRLHSNQFHHVRDTQVLQRLTPAARARVLELDLAAAGLNDTGTLRPFGFAYATHMPLEVFINGLPLRLAEWPDNNFINIQSTPDGEKGKRLGYEDPGDGRDRRWAREGEPWVYGWWYYSWADSSVPVAHVDPDNRTISLQRHTRYGFNIGQYDPSYNNSEARYSTQGGYFRVINMLCELDTPGEYYVDRGSNKLYVWPNTPHHTLSSSDIIYASVLDDCITVDSQTGRLFLQDFTLEACRYRGVMMSSARNVTLSNMEVKNTGGTGILCTGDCRGITVMASDVHDVSHGIYLMGGDYQTLQSSHNVVRDNHIWHNARYGAFSNDAVTIEGVGVLVAHNHIHHGQYAGIKWRVSCL
ncbi:uncharacterized protein LOC143274642 [Babylonia areolata]|uniref:uncharacterized protein LOC143274642 n=1 Tax=Babylonia areolata TaxID=304850 RepID=UPI003FD21E87